MGVIKKQSISGSIYSYLGVVLGFVTIGLLFPRIFSTEEVGLLRILVSYSVLFAQFAGLGFSTATIKLFPYFRSDDGKHHGFLGLFLLISLLGFVIAGSVYLLLRPNIVEHAEGKSELFVAYYYYVLPLIFFTLLFNVFDTYYRVLYNAVKGIVAKEVIQRLAILVVIVLFYFDILSFHLTVIFYTLALISPSVLLFFSLSRNKRVTLKIDLRFIDAKLLREMATVAFFGLMSGFSGMLVMNIDILMVDRILGLSAAGIYSVTFFFGMLILVPLRTMGKISSVVIADAWKRNDLDTIGSIYKKSSLSLSVMGILLFIGIWGNIDNVFFLIKDDYLSGKMVIFYIGVANLFDVFLGVSPHIIVNSKHYRYFSALLIGYALLIVFTNLLFIPRYGIVGAALASLLSKFIYNLIKYIFIYKKFGLQPFELKHLYLLLIGIASYYISTLVPVAPHFVVDIVVRSTVIFFAFSLPVYYFNISEDINERVNSFMLAVKNRF
ncbi:MAG: oligosaccharide flippase family protein [Bacteroidales bacterium]|nr:oligosaccharide flippase family protein [Bacteroidales bacterium]